MDEALQAELASSGVIADTVPFAAAKGFGHTELVGLCKSLQSACAALCPATVPPLSSFAQPLHGGSRARRVR